MPMQERDEFDAMREAMPDLERLGRYERRAWSRQKRAMREFIAIKASSFDDERNASHQIPGNLDGKTTALISLDTDVAAVWHQCLPPTSRSIQGRQ